MKVFFHVQHLLGIGHLRRAERLSRALRAQGFEVVIASGGAPVAGIPVQVQLPPLFAADLGFRNLLDEAGRPVDEAWKRRRAATLLDAWRAARADVLMIELFPFGRRQLRFELLPLLEEARRLSTGPRVRRPLVVCSLRDLLQPKPGREQETLELVERYFDRILVHGDARVARLERTFPPASRLGKKLHYTGYVVDQVPVFAKASDNEVLVSAGGGVVGRELLATAMRARGRTLLKEATWRVLAGVNCSDADFRALGREAGPGIVLERSREDFTALLASCALSISQAGYNTVAEALKARVPTVLVPFSGGAETEQGLRARLLAERGAAEVVEESSLSAETLAAAVDRAVRRGRPPTDLVDLDGAMRTAELLRGWCA